MTVKGVVVALLYAGSSVLITFGNKQLLSKYHFRHENFLVASQTVFTWMCLALLKSVGIVTYKDWSWTIARKMLHVAFLFTMYVVFSLSSLRMLNIPMWTALRRLTALLILATEQFYHKQPQAPKLWLSVALMIVGAAVAAGGDLDYNFWGYCHVLTLCFVSAVYMTAVKYARADTGLDEQGVLAYTAALTTPAFVCWVYWSGELDAVMADPAISDPNVLLWFFISVVLAGSMNYLTYLCININSPLTTSVTGQAKNVVSTALALAIDPPATMATNYVCGIVIGLCASFWYASIKYQQSKESKAKAAKSA